MKLKSAAALITLLIITFCIPVEAKKRRHHATPQQIERYCRENGAGVGVCRPKLSPCAEARLAGRTGASFETDPTRANLRGVPLVQEGEEGPFHPMNVDPCQ